MEMKKLFLCFFMFSSFVLMGQQNFEFSLNGGYTGRNSFAINGGSALIENSQAFSGAISYFVQPEFSAELFYARQPTILSAFSSFDNLRIREEGSVSYWMVGIRPEIPSTAENVSFYMSFRLGGVTFSTRSDEFERSIKLATSLGGGMRYHITDNLGFQLTSNLFLPIFDAGSTLWFGTDGAGAGATSWCPILQLNVNAGLFFQLN